MLSPYQALIMPLRLPLLRDDQIFDSNVILNFCIVPWRLKTRLSNCLLISNMNFRVSQIYREVNTCDKIASFAISVQDFFRSDGSMHQFISEDFCKNRIGVPNYMFLLFFIFISPSRPLALFHLLIFIYSVDAVI
ncbi:hypothetical protein JHK87_023503 [Glycine soja]|nr:hypothetical protein JHK87_023503 [Glycine soja]